MNVLLHVVHGPARSGKTEHLLEVCRDRPGSLWLSPSSRHAEQLRTRLASTEILVRTFDELASELLGPDVRPPGRFRQRSHLDSICSDLARHGELPHYVHVHETRGFLDAVVGLTDELAELGIDPDRFGTVAQAVGVDRSAKLVDCMALLWRYGQPSDRESLLVRASQRLSDAGPVPGIVVLDEFVSFTSGERAILTSLATSREQVVLALPGSLRDEDETAAPLQALVESVRACLPSVPVEMTPLTETADRRPAGLQALSRLLFQDIPPEGKIPTEGVRILEAPGALGEARMVARSIRELAEQGVPLERIIVTTRNLDGRESLIEEVFAEYGLPVDDDAIRPLGRDPILAALVRAATLPDDDWPFPAVSALLRNTLFRPTWPEMNDNPEMPARCEALLRGIGEPRDREAYLRAVDVWAERPPEALEDEQAEGSRRRHLHELAKTCQPFLRRFFALWDGLPISGTPTAFVHWLSDVAHEIGFDRAATENAASRASWETFWRHLHRWSDETSRRTGVTIDRPRFQRVLTNVAVAGGTCRRVRGDGAVRLVPADVACHLECDHLFVIGLGEGSFPMLAGPRSLLDDADRALLTQAGLPFPSPADRLGKEMLLFRRLVDRPERSLTLSYPAIDEKGQPLLPSSFLTSVRECFPSGEIPTEQQRMLIEGYLTRRPMSGAERRARLATTIREQGSGVLTQTDDLTANLRDAHVIAQARFHATEFTAYEGALTESFVSPELQRRFGPTRVFSPTSLETYIACPFRFFLQHVLKLELLEEPGEGIEQTRRGSAYHRALSRYHLKMRDEVPDLLGNGQIPEGVGEELSEQLIKAVDEYAQRAGSPAAQMLWRLEGQRLCRSAMRYPTQWERFVKPWREVKAIPRPQFFELDFGLSSSNPDPTAVFEATLDIEVGGVRVSLGGKIDRIDVTQLPDGIGFWIIDYKTGRASHYTASDIQNFVRLQLPLYALAVDRIVFADKPSRPLGLAYWLVTDTGAKPVLPASGSKLQSWFANQEQWQEYRDKLETWVATLVAHIRSGRFPLSPRSEHCTDTCSFGQICRINQARSQGKTWQPETD